MSRNEAVFTYSGEEPTVDHAGDLVVDKALDVLDKMLDVQLKQLDIIRGSLTTRIFLREGTSIRRVDPPAPKDRQGPTCEVCKTNLPSNHSAATTATGRICWPCYAAQLKAEEPTGKPTPKPCYHCGFTLEDNDQTVRDWYGWRHDTCAEHPK